MVNMKDSVEGKKNKLGNVDNLMRGWTRDTKHPLTVYAHIIRGREGKKNVKRISYSAVALGNEQKSKERRGKVK